MNNPVALLILFFAIVVVWAVLLLTILVFFKGAARGRDEYESRLPGHPEQAGAHRDGSQYR